MRKKLFLAAMAVVALAGCTQSDEVFEGPDLSEQAIAENAIQFGTYLGQTVQTRAGKTGSLNTEGLKADDAGFGVFAYYTNTADYTYSAVNTDGTTGQTTMKPNFMYNQKVTWNSTLDDAYITKWTYSPVKYWPNNISTTAVDDQDNDTSSDPAKASEDGGKISFFAYAPYVEAASGTVGITDMTANTAESDPIITYIISTTGDPVDLLWGTYGETSINVNGSGTNAGVAYNASGSYYAKSILPNASTSPTGYRVNADLTKQKTNGKVDFAFKHALAKVGGSVDNSSSMTNVYGLMVILDIDDMEGAEKGGIFNNEETKVTVTSVDIKAKSFVDTNNNGKGDDGEYLKTLEGKLNLANGHWQITGTKGNSTEAATVTHLINQNGASAQGTLNTDIAEPATAPDKTPAGWNGLHNGVLTTPQNVYASEAAPLIFFPGTYPELTITVDYTVRTKDANLEDAYSEVKQTITKKVTFNKAVELNKQYSLLMHLGLTSVKFTASVSDWSVAGDDNNNGVIDGTETLDIQDVFVPINVAAYSVKMEGATASGSVAPAGENYTTTAGKIHWYDYESGTWKDDAGTGTYSMSTTSDVVTITGTPPTITVAFAANTGTRTRTMVVTASYTGTDFAGSKAPENEVFTYTQAPKDLQITSSATPTAATAGSATLAIKDAGDNDVNPVAAGNVTTVTVPDGWTYSLTSDGVVINWPASITPDTYNVTIKVNDASQTVTYTVS